MSWRDGANFSGSLLVATGAISEQTNKIVLKDLIPERDSFSVTKKNKQIPVVVPVFCSVIGAVARGTVFISKGFSEGSKVYWWRDFSKPGMETESPETHIQGDSAHHLLSA